MHIKPISAFTKSNYVSDTPIYFERVRRGINIKYIQEFIPTVEYFETAETSRVDPVETKNKKWASKYWAKCDQGP